MHRQIMTANPDQQVHHINRNTLDNRRSNLQLVTPLAHAFLQAEANLFRTNPDAHAACVNFLNRHGVTTLCHPQNTTSSKPGEPPKHTSKYTPNTPNPTIYQ